MIGALALCIVLTARNNAEQVEMRHYDGCYEQYASNHVPSEGFERFITTCLASYNQ